MRNGGWTQDARPKLLDELGVKTEDDEKLVSQILNDQIFRERVLDYLIASHAVYAAQRMTPEEKAALLARVLV